MVIKVGIPEIGHIEQSLHFRKNQLRMSNKKGDEFMKQVIPLETNYM